MENDFKATRGRTSPRHNFSSVFHIRAARDKLRIGDSRVNE